jgi:16S rRNA (cytosine1402-N4)-methyltransferase
MEKTRCQKPNECQIPRIFDLDLNFVSEKEAIFEIEDNMELEHIPVLLQEAIELLNVREDHWYVDATFGRGGHTREILHKGGRVIAIDQDSEAIQYGFRHFVRDIEAQKLVLVRENFEHIDSVVREHGRGKEISGILADFGISSPQVDDPKRGFSFQEDAPLDMRMDDRLAVTAKDLINGLGKGELYELFTRLSGEQHARVIVDAIVRSRREKPIATTKELASVIEKVVHRQGHLHPATKVFQALRIAVNDELGSIERFLPKAFDVLSDSGRLITIAFHEGEDRLVKHFEKNLAQSGRALELTDKPIEPDEEEIGRNIRSRSGKLRAIEKL